MFFQRIMGPKAFVFQESFWAFEICIIIQNIFGYNWGTFNLNNKHITDEHNLLFYTDDNKSNNPDSNYHYYYHDILYDILLYKWLSLINRLTHRATKV